MIYGNIAAVPLRATTDLLWRKTDENGNRTISGSRFYHLASLKILAVLQNHLNTALKIRKRQLRRGRIHRLVG